jgi:hypothetical protein
MVSRPLFINMTYPQEYPRESEKQGSVLNLVFTGLQQLVSGARRRTLQGV